MKRLKELDSLRGLAALTVLFAHIITLFYRSKESFDQSKFLFYMLYTPFKVFFSAHEAVIFFFILSGFSLSLQFYEKQSTSLKTYGKFIIRRITRIYIPYCVALILAVTIVFRNVSISSDILIGHYLLIGSFNYVAIMGVVWSLAHEMRISLIFPFIMSVVRRVYWLTGICIAFALSCVASYMAKNHAYFDPQLPLTNYYSTLHYISLFIIGALLAKHKDALVKMFNTQGSFSRLFVLAIGVIMFTNIITQAPSTPSNYLNDWIVSFGVCIIIIASLSMKNFSKFLLFTPIHFIGKISYSLYLTHLLVLYYFMNHYSSYSTWLLTCLSIVVAIVVSALMYYLIEKPSILLGKLLTGYKPMKNALINNQKKKARAV
ncbi:acyltransferase [Cohnella sp. REN36]|uniref:acyltransferase family protein n=1 Tax=Cohnella sp. REN36 TaxID=2887347 RepID=UPI001D151229|nr:acyltransferase [Cohnella sp. REN36]MCC3375047.1 acyltransferase [Cohnella sp. REN36]